MKTNRPFAFSLAAILGIAVAHVSMSSVHAQVIANSVTEFSGNQGQDGWFNGYRNYTLSGETEDYDPKADFIAYSGGAGQGPWDGVGQFWTGTAWDLNTAAAGPWTTQASQTTHPNGNNSPPNEEHWTIRRWAATELPAATVLQVVWTVRKQDTAGGNGVTGGIWLNGKKLVAVAIAASSSQGVTRTNYLSVKPTDVIDLVLTPVGTDGQRTDGNDNSITTMRIETVADSDSDGLPDPWENLYSPGDLAKLKAAGDADGDGLTDLAEMPIGTDPTKADTDGDGLPDAAESNTGKFVSASNTGTDPLRKDTDGDGRSDGEEIKVTPTTDPFDADSDDDNFPDGLEASSGHNPADANENPSTTAIAKSNDEFSGTQGENDWRYGYRNVTVDRMGNRDYDPVKAFIEFTPEQFTGTQWDLNTAAAAPWDEIGRENTHPNGPSPIHWTVRRWVANKVTKPTPLALHWHVRKSNVGCGNGVTGALHINGKEVDKAVIASADNRGVVRTYFANLLPGDIVDLVHRPTGTDGSEADGCDGSVMWLLVDPLIPLVAIQPDGTVFIPAGAGDTDGDGLPDVWERLYFATDLTKLARTGDSDKDGLADLLEYQRDSNPTLADTDGDGLSDLVETGTGIFVSVNDTGSSPKKADSDGDGIGDKDEVQGKIVTNPNKSDTDSDGFTDPDEIADATNPNDKADNVLTFVIANSIAEFSGVQGSNGWFNGYRNFTLDGGATNYNPKTDFIPYKGGESQGPWDGDAQQWTGGAWDLNTASAGPWTAQSAQDIHPNGENSPPNEEHWATRRWVASEITKVTPATIIWQVRKTNLANDGVTGALYLNGNFLDSITIAGTNGTNPVRRVSVTLNPNDIVDLALSPQGINNRTDGSDGSITWFWVDTRPPAPPATTGVKFESVAFDAAQKRLTLAWGSAPGGKYTIETSEDLRTWSVVQADVPSGGTRTTHSETIDPAKGARFYRIRQ